MKKNITFAFQAGRKKRLATKNLSYGKEFFYSYHSFDREFGNIRVIEFDADNNLFRKVRSILYKSIRYITTIPFYSEKVINRNNKKILKHTEYLICVNQRVCFSLMPISLIKKIRGSLKITVFVMGLFLDIKRHPIRMFLRDFFIKFFCWFSDNIIFLSENEMSFATANYSKYSNKFYFLPFSIDTDFWVDIEKNNSKSHILFIGNDEKRDFEFVKKIPMQIPSYNFIFISKFIHEKEFDGVQNLKIINGKWSEDTLSDKELREIYKKSIISLIPLHDSYQPSGQSVALQSMSMGIPTMITRTKGFWDYSKFEHKENIIFMESNNLEDWVLMINNLIKDEKLRNHIGQKSIENTKVNYNLEIFYAKLKEIMFT